MGLGFLALSGAAIGGIVAGVLVLIVVAVVLRPKKKDEPAQSAPAKTEPRIETSPNNMPSMVAPVRETPAPKPPTAPVPKPPTAQIPKAPEPAAAPSDDKLLSTSGRVISVPTDLPAGEPSAHDLAPLEPSLTGEAPMLAESSLEPSLDDMKIGTDEMPRMGTQELPSVGTREMQAVAEKPRYRTPDAQKMQEAIETMKCPKCGQPTFVGRETPEELAGDGVGMFKLEGRCGACGHKAQVIDMRIG
jgi:hypothetical protein